MKLDGLPSTVMPPSAVTLTFDLLTAKSNQHIYEPIYICDQNWVKFPSLFLRCGVHKFSGRTNTQTDSRTNTAKTVCLRRRRLDA